MSLIAVIILVIILAALGTFTPFDPSYKRLFYWLAAGVVIVYLLLLVFGGATWPGHRVIVD